MAAAPRPALRPAAPRQAAPAPRPAAPAPAARPAPAPARPAAPAPRAAAPQPAPAAPRPGPARAAAPAPAAPAQRQPAPAPARGPARPAGGSDIQKRLAKMRESWNNTKEESSKGGFGVNVPVGTYICNLTDGKMQPYGKADVAVIFQFTVSPDDPSGEAGEQLDIFDTLTDPDRLVYSQRDMRKLGIDVDAMEDPTQIEEVLPELIKQNLLCRIQVAEGNTGGMFVRLQKVLDDGSGADPNDGPVDDGSGDLPFEGDLADPGDPNEQPLEPAEGDLPAEGDQPQDEGAPLEPIANDPVYWEQGGVQRTGVVMRVDTDKRIATVKDDRTSRPVNIAFDQLTVMAAEDPNAALVE